MKLSKKGNKSCYVIGLVTASLSIITVISAMLLSIPVTNAETTTSNASISVGMSCSMAVTPGTGGTATSDGYSYSATVTPGVPSEIEGSILTTICNGPGNYSLYAIGYSGDSYDTPTNTQMISSAGSNNIVTGTATSGSTSNWAFKLASVSGTSAPTIVSPYSSYSNIPGDNFAKVATMLGTTGLASTSAVQAKYQVYASSTQPAGAYTGKVKYTMVYPSTAPAPSTKLYMQNATLADCGKTMIDSRDGKSYTTSLIGGKCWMTTNLNLAGGTTLSSNDTDMDASWTLPTANGFQSGNRLPASSTSGFSDDDTMACVYNSTKTGTSCSSPGCHGYYSWTAATLGSGLSITAGNTDAPYSICPKGWHLPNTRTDTDSSSDFRALMIALGGSNSVSDYTSSTTPTGATMSSTLQASPNNFLLAGSYDYGSFSGGHVRGYYWSATSGDSSTGARSLYFSFSNANSAGSSNRRSGRSVRCVFGS